MEKLTSIMLFYESAVQASVLRGSNHLCLYRACIALRTWHIGDLKKGIARDGGGGNAVHNGRESRVPALFMAVILLRVAPWHFMLSIYCTIKYNSCVAKDQDHVACGFLSACCCAIDGNHLQVFRAHVETLAKRGKKQVVPEGLYDALIAVVDLLQKMVRPRVACCVPRVL